MDIGRYRAVRPLGRGGMAEVFEAIATGAGGFERRVAIKRMLPSSDVTGPLGRMFLDEARIASQLHHANIVAVLDFGLADGLPFQVLAYVDGLDAAKLVGLPTELVLHIGVEIAHALDYVHHATDAGGESLGIVHRDVSPANILVSWTGDVYLADFGIAFAKNRAEKTRAGTTKGTVLYSAPEQVTAGEIDARTDVFALGAVLHRLMTGASPLAGEDAMASLLAGRPLALDPSLPDDVARVIARAVARSKGERFATAAQMADALAQLRARRIATDPKAALQAYMAGTRTPVQAHSAGKLDDLLGLEFIAAGDEGGIRSFTTLTARARSERNPSPAARPSGATTIGTVALLAVGLAGLLGWQLTRAPHPPAQATLPEPEPEPETEPEPEPEPESTPEEAVTPASPRRPKPATKTKRHHELKKPKREPVPDPPPPSGTGYIKIGGKAAHLSQVIIDGALRGHAPNTFKLSLGAHQVVLRDADGSDVQRRKVVLTERHTRTSPYPLIVKE